jgi:hypothetical protein
MYNLETDKVDVPVGKKEPSFELKTLDQINDLESDGSSIDMKQSQIKI